MKKTMIRVMAAVALLGSLTACGTLSKLESINQTPQLKPIVNPQAEASYRPVSMPMPDTTRLETHPNSLWRPGARSFFKDQRASNVGDIITVQIDFSDTADFSNTTTRERDNSEDTNLDALLGLEAELGKVLPEGIATPDVLGLSSTHNTLGTGTISRTETLKINVAAVIAQKLPNGNLVLHGRQELRVNGEVRELQIAGIIRPEDISSTNSVDFDNVAEARLAYGGRGYISDVQQARYGQQALDILMPF